MHHKVLELNVTELCNFSCVFCPRSTYYDNRDLHMSIPVINTIIRQLRDHGLIQRVHISGRGEPGLFKNLEYLIHKLYDLKINALPNLQIALFTNGTNFKKNLKLYEKLDYIKVSCYDETSEEDRNYFWELKNKLDEIYKWTGTRFYFLDVVDVGEKALQFRYEKEILGKEDIQYNLGGSGMILNNRAGSINNNWTTKDPLKTKFCHKPYRDIYINYNGDYNLCSAVWQNIEALANIKDTPLNEWAEHPNYLKYVEQKWREMSPCSECNMSCPEDFKEALLDHPDLGDVIKYYQRKK